MNKKLLSLAVVGALFTSAANAVDLRDDTAIAEVASEVVVSGATSVQSATELDVISLAGFTIPLSSTYYVRYDLTGATFGTAVVAADLVISDTDTATAAPVAAVSSGGTDGDSFVIFSVTTTGGANDDVDSTETFTLSGVDDYDITAKANASVAVALYETAGNAVNQTSPLASDSGTLLTFVNNIATTSGTESPKQINVTDNSKSFVSGGTCVGAVSATLCTEILDLDVTETANDGGTLAETATDLTADTAFTAAQLVITGDFTPAQDLTAGAPDGTYTLTQVYIDADGGCDTRSVNADAITDTTATFDFVDTEYVQADAAVVCMEVNGVGVVSENTYTAVWTPTAAAGYTEAATSLTGATLSKNGSTTALDLLLTPGGAFANYVRVSNKSSIAGDVFITLYNDSGDSVVVNLGDIAGIASNSLGAQSSTKLISISDIYAAAQTADATFMVTGASTKLRAVIEGEFSSISAQNVSVATDGTTFSTF